MANPTEVDVTVGGARVALDRRDVLTFAGSLAEDLADAVLAALRALGPDDAARFHARLEAGRG